METIEFKPDQEVINPLRTEWGVGRILSVEPGPCGKGQRVRVNFSGAGVKTMMIPPGRLTFPQTRAKTAPLPTDPTTDVIADRLRELPAVIFDQKATMEARLDALITLYRFKSDTRGIFDWAIDQLQEKDPLEYFTADELKAYFDDFCRNRDHWMKKLRQQAISAGRQKEFDEYLNRKTPDWKKHLQ